MQLQISSISKGSYIWYAFSAELSYPKWLLILSTTLWNVFRVVDLHGKLTHPHIIKLYGVCKDEPVWLVLEFAGEGEVSWLLISFL